MGGTAKAGVKNPNAMLDAVEHPFCNTRAVEVPLSDLQDGLVHGQVVVARRNQQVDFLQDAMLVYVIFVKQGASGCFDHTDALRLVDKGLTSYVWVGDLRIFQGLGNLLQSEKDFNEPGVVIVKAAGHRRAAWTQPSELPQLPVGPRRACKIADIQPSQRANPVKAVGAMRFVSGNFK